jgi:cell wall assembly regulator SMI1
MAFRTVDGSGRQLREQDVAAVEEQLGYHLPEDYRRFILAHNGGRPVPDYFPIQGNPYFGDHASVHELHCIASGEYLDLRRQVQVFRDRVPPELLPIAHDPGGNLLCLGVSGLEYGKVYYWDHEQQVAEGETPDYENVYLVADTFADFLEQLSPAPGETSA